MRNTLRSAFVALCLLYAWGIPESKADSLVVATCGTLPLAYAPGATRLDTVDTTGKLCTSSTGGGGGGAVTIADGADVAQGSTTDAACGTDNGTCTLAAVAKRIAQRLTTINTTLGAAPMQAGGNIGTVSAVTAITNALPAGANVIGHVIADTGSTTAVTGNVTAVQPTGTNLHMVCDSGCSGSTAPADASTFTPSTTPQSPVGGFFQTTATNNALTNLQMGAIQLTANRAIFSNLRNAAGTEVGTSTTPLQVSLANTGANATAVLVNQPTGTNLHVVADTGSTTAVTGNVTVVQGTGTNLHAVIDTGSTTAVTQATGTNLHTVVDSGAITVSATNLSTNIAQINGVTPLMGNGATGTGSARVTVASDNTAFSVNAQPTPVTSGGLTTFFLQPTASDNHTNIKNGAGQLYHVTVTNNSATINYLRFYNAATGFNGCNSATNLVYQLAIPASTSGAGFVQDIALGLVFSTGISICVTTGYATTDTTNATASAMSLLVAYK
jgi:hypothetical protein